MTLGDKIRKYRTLKGLTQAQLGSMVKLTGDRIRQYENDVRKPKDGKLFEIADALDINPSTLAEPDFDDPTSVMHVLFELEDIYGLHFEKVGENYQLAFSKGEYSSANWIIEGLSAWVKKRDELQPDINDSNSTIADKKNDYIRWKARYPYNFAEEITNNFALVQKFNEDASSLLSSDRHPITRFSEFYRSLLALEDAGIRSTISVDEIMSKRSATFYIELDYIMNSSNEIKKLYMEFRLIFHEYFPSAFVPSAAFLPELSRCKYPAVLPHLPSQFPEHAQHDHTYQKRLALYSFLLIIYDFLYAYHPTPSEYRYIFVSAFDIYSSNFPPLL